MILFAILLVRVWDPAYAQHARDLVFDTYQRLMPRAYDSEIPVRIVDVDGESRARFGPAPWPRARLARLIDRLAEAGAAAIVLDDVLSEPDPTSPEQALKALPDTEEVRALGPMLAGIATYDSVFAAAMVNAPVVTGFLLTQGSEAGLDDGRRSAEPRRPVERAAFSYAGDDPRFFLPHYRNAIVNLADIGAASAGNGALNAIYEYDRVERKMPLVLQLNG